MVPEADFIDYELGRLLPSTPKYIERLKKKTCVGVIQRIHQTNLTKDLLCGGWIKKLENVRPRSELCGRWTDWPVIAPINQAVIV